MEEEEERGCEGQEEKGRGQLQKVLAERSRDNWEGSGGDRGPHKKASVYSTEREPGEVRGAGVGVVQAEQLLQGWKGKEFGDHLRGC